MDKISIGNCNFSENYIDSFYFNPIRVCPVCKANIVPHSLYAFAYDIEPGSTNVCILNYCPGCYSPFINTYKVGIGSNHIAQEIECIASEPNCFVRQEFDKEISALSPQFDKIYNQALAAETSGLDEIAGLGYRKSLEFLIKDFAIHEHPDEVESIKSKPLAQCIKNYIDDPRITTLAERSAWLGNDEAHYVRKQENRDVSDMKSFIKATVYFIGMILVTEDAESITPKK